MSREPTIQLSTPDGVVFQLRIDQLLLVAALDGELRAPLGPLTVVLFETLPDGFKRNVFNETYAAEDFPRRSDE